MTVGSVLIALLVVCTLLGSSHWYLWRRLVRDVSARGSVWRRTGTVLAFALPVLVVVNFAIGRGATPFTLQQVLAWPGYMWMALLLYLLLALLAGEVVRPLLRRVLERRSPEARPAAAVKAGAPADASADSRVAAPADVPADVPADDSAGGTGRTDTAGPS
ncbi:MAG TPA: metallophosphoesterase, partial [Streptomyces sp.]|nr:metallophosphoesterase [Streptomyces sp.]